MRLRLRSERGQATVVTVLFLTSLLCMAGAVLDVGAWFRADRKLQANADAAALAAAQALPEDTGFASALANEYAAKNNGAVDELTFSSTILANDTVKVTMAEDVPGFFTKVFGLDSVEVHASAKARTGGVSSARYAAPIAVDEKHPLLQCAPQVCFNEATELDLQKTGPGAFRLLNLDNSKGGTGQQILAEWIRNGYDGYMPLGDYYQDAGAKFNAHEVKAALDDRLGDELLFPVYRSVEGGGSNLTYEIVGWVGFVVTDFKGQGNGGQVFGHFTQVIWEGILSESGGEPDFGVRAVALIE